MNYHHLPYDEVLKEIGSRHDGLSDAEAADRLAQNGKNALVSKKKKPAVVKFLSQFTDPMIIVLLVAAVISAVLAIVRSEYTELIDSGIILLIVIINAVIGFVQESKAENALEALKNKNKPYAKVLRSGQRKTILSEELVVGDIVFLEAGDIVPADMRLLSSASLKIEESALTGESVPVDKDAEAVVEENAALGDRLNTAYSGGTVSYGRGEGVVTATGMDTETGKIAKMLNEVKEAPSPLDRQLSKTAKILSFAVLGIAIIIFLVRAFAYGDYKDMNRLVDAFMTSVAIAVAAIPEGLPAVVTIVLAMGVRKMSTRRAIVKNLSSVETLGCCEVICSDKTGTLTLNKMTVKECYCPDTDESLLRRVMALCNDAAQTADGLVGDPTETALVAYAIEQGDDFGALTATYPRVNEKPFDSVRKLMTTVHECGNGKVSYTKGAPDMLIARCKYILKNGQVQPMTEDDIALIKDANSQMAQKALRVLAAAYVDGENLDEEDLIFVGLTGMIDPPRAEVKAAVAKCRSAGIQTVMITGDHVETAKAIARELDILRDGDLCATGAELDEMSDEYLNENIGRFAVFARVSPENKVRIVKAVKHNNKVVAMTGDGVNDAPSIKEADIGIGMGITGTQVSKDAADMILTDDNFATIVGAVEEGRKIFSNITKAIQFLLSANIAEVICLFVSSVVLAGVVGATDPNFVFLTPVMILWVNLVTDSFPALSLGVEKAENDVMEQPPRKSDKSLFAGNMGKDIIIQGILQSALVMTSFCLGYFVMGSHEQASTMAFVSLCLIQLFHSFNLRSQRHSVLNKKFFSNKFLNLSALLGIALTVAVVVIPGVNTVFHTAPLDVWEWLVAVGVAVAIIPLVELQKLIERAVAKRKKKNI
ncbi:MAG: calcium-translocating P-type ATPase, PMCA-type [Candidatus Coproplasma sp.]